MIAGWDLWIGFFSFLIFLIFFDLFVLGGNSGKALSPKMALGGSLFWVALSFGFAFFLWFYVNAHQGPAMARTVVDNFISGYLIEKSLSLDNVFVFLLIFRHFKVPAGYQRRVLTWGVLGAIVLRALMIGVGSALIEKFSWILYLFAAFLIFSGFKMLFLKHRHPEIEAGEHALLRFLRKHLRITEAFQGDRFFIKKKLLWYVTPLFIVLIMIEFSDIIFASDSLPAVFAITRDPFVVFSSNMFAVIGLRMMHFLLADFISRFKGLHYGLSLILLLIGAKLLLSSWVHVSAEVSLFLILGILILSALLGLRAK